MKHCKSFIVLSTLALLFNAGLLQAKNSAVKTYKLEYANHSPIKKIPLKHATIRLEKYQFENPHGYMLVKTDRRQRFSVNRNQDFEVVGIQGERKFNAHCSGEPTPNKSNIKIMCRPL